MDKIMIRNLIIGIFIFIIFIWMMVKGNGVLQQDREMKIQNGKDCEGIIDLDKDFECCRDCHLLNKTLLKYEQDSSFFGNNIKNCFCKSNNEVEQIW